MATLISVIIPAFNSGRFVREAVESVLAQSHRALEILVVDDGSTERVDWVAEMDPVRVTYLWKPNGGPASARNAGVRRARGEYVAFLDADDLWEPYTAARQLAALTEHPDAAMVYGAVRRMSEAGELLEDAPRPRARPSGWIAEPLFAQNTIPTSTVLARREHLEMVGLFNESPELIAVEDYDLWLRVAERYPVIGLHEPLARYRMHPGGLGKGTLRSYDGEQRVVERAAARDLTGARQRRLSRRLSRLRFACGHELWTAGELADARTQFGLSVRHQPLYGRAWVYLLASLPGQPGVSAARALKSLVLPPRQPSDGDRRLRILHVLNTLETGGAEHVALNLATRLDPSRYALHVCSLSGEGSLAEPFRRLQVRVHALRRRPGVDVRMIPALAALIRNEGIDLVHTHNAGPWLYGGLAARWAGARLCHTEHSNVFPHQRVMQAVECGLVRWTETLISDSDKVTRQLAAQGIPAGRITTVPNGVETARFTGPVDRAAVRRALGIDAEAPVVGTVGRLAAVKDQETLLAAFALVWSAYPESWLLMAGTGPLRAELEARALMLGIAGRVQFLGDRSDVPALLGAMDVFTLSSVSEGLPLTVLEAMASGLPVVSTRVGGIPEAVLDGDTGLLVPPADPRAMADAIIGLLADPAQRRRLGMAGRARAREWFDLGRMVDAYETAYRHEFISQRG
jgi:glycosyltransferase involved in cell wall biosynthesis